MNTNWENIIAGDQNEYGETYLYFYDRFYNYAFKFTEDAGLVEDTIQEVLLKLWIDRSKLKHVANPSAYLFTSFRNELFRKLKSRRLADPSKLPFPEVEFSQDAIIIQRESDDHLQRNLQQAIDHLSPRQREAIFLRFYEGLSYEEVSSILGITHKATYKLVARALGEIKERMGVPLCLLITLLRNIHSNSVPF